MYVFGKSLCRSDYFQFLALYHLIADAPAEYGGVVAVAKHHRFNITFPPLVKKHGIVMFVLGITPSVKSLVDNEQSLTIAFMQKGFRRHIVRGTHGIEASFFQQSHLACFGCIERTRT